MSNRGRKGENREFLNTMCDEALSNIRRENERLMRRVRKLEETVESKDKTIKELIDLQVVKDSAIDRLSQLCKDSETEVSTLVQQLDNILSGYIGRAKRKRISSGETTD